MTQHVNPKAIRKAHQAADHLARAARLLREAAELSDGSIASGHGDFLAWAARIEELLSSDHGEAGIGPTLQKLAAKDEPKRTRTYEHRRPDGRIVRVSIPENER